MSCSHRTAGSKAYESVRRAHHLFYFWCFVWFLVFNAGESKRNLRMPLRLYCWFMRCFYNRQFPDWVVFVFFLTVQLLSELLGVPGL